ncbi:MAG: radical SAM family heme chaperone HemW [Candidatus Omnitrophica bacterium]|nr:radical SAM family heme chaperone HemW [Candidatus Omnitrophota bacterium]
MSPEAGCGIYVHIPFCRRKCPYCDFNSIDAFSSATLRRYLRALLADIRLTAAAGTGDVVRSIYIGGGTPSLLSVRSVSTILASIAARFPIAPDSEVTLEANPASVDRKKLRQLRRCGISRLSIGVQSFQDRLLRVLGRIHNGAQARAALRQAQTAGFSNVSIDLMYAIAGQSLSDWEADLRQAIAGGACHVSFYDLTIEPGTSLFRRRRTFVQPAADRQAQMYRRGCRLLAAAGFRQYEISSFAQAGFESRHNQGYWRNEPYLGFGAGAFSYWDGVRFYKQKNVVQYIYQAQRGCLVRFGKERLCGQRRLRETLMLGLRLMRGIDLTAAAQRAGCAPDAPLQAAIAHSIEDGWLRRRGSRIRLSRRGILAYNDVVGELLRA